MAAAATCPAIELRNLHRQFGATWAVDDISFVVEPGQVVGYIGPNGAGKTTSMRILATLDLPTAGDAYVDGFSVIDDPDLVRSRLGFMPDAFGTYSNVGCREYLDFFARAYGLAGRQRHQAVRRVMAFTRLDGIAEKPIHGLSKGMKQRLCLARAMVHDPSVLILDEPAAGLDPRARIELRDLIGQMASEGKTLLISSHILTELAEMCDRVAIIEQGKLLATGTVEQILSGRAHDAEEGHQQTTLDVQVVDDAPALSRWLEQRDDIGELKTAPGGVVFCYARDPQLRAELLREMIQAGFPIVKFSARDLSLEEVFMRVTEGKLQ
ncbi:MAG: ABC transporter ATP-binding protein [Pirellulaceae bacterium]